MSIGPPEVDIPTPKNKQDVENLILDRRLGQGRESQVYLSLTGNGPIAVKCFRKTTPNGHTNVKAGPRSRRASEVVPNNRSSSVHRGQTEKPEDNVSRALSRISDIGDEVMSGGFLSPQFVQRAPSGIASPKYLSRALSNPSIGESFDEFTEAYINETSILMGIKHPNIVGLEGFGCNMKHCYLALEFMEKGTLLEVLDSNVTLSGDRRTQLAIGICEGMLYLTKCSPKIVHADLKSLNILISKNWIPKISDFGVSAVFKENDKDLQLERKQTHGGTVQWTAPELLLNKTNVPNEKSDIFSFGVILWEIATRKKPWRNVNTRVVMDSIKTGIRLPKPENWNLAFREVVEGCWEPNPKRRPTFTRVRRQLQFIEMPQPIGRKKTLNII